MKGVIHRRGPVGAPLRDPRFRWEKHLVMAPDWVSYELRFEGLYVPHELRNAAQEGGRFQFYPYLAYWMETEEGDSEPRLSRYLEAQERYYDLVKVLERDDGRRRNDPDRLPPEEKVQLTAECAEAFAVHHNLEAVIMHRLYGYELRLVEVEPRNVVAQHQLTEILKAAPAEPRKVRPRIEKPAVAAPAVAQASLF